MTYKKYVLMFMLVPNAMQAMNGYAAVLSTSEVTTKIDELWADDALADAQKVAKMKLFFHTVDSKVRMKCYSDALNPRDRMSGNPLDDALNTHRSLGLFKLLLAHKADPNIAMGSKGTIASQALLRSEPFKQAIDEQLIIDLVEPELALALLGTNEAEVAKRLKVLIDEKKINRDAMFKVLDDCVLRKNEEHEILDNVALALQEALHNRPYVRKPIEAKKTLRAELAAMNAPYSPEAPSLDSADTQDSSVELSQVYRNPLILGGALACIAAGFGGKYILDALLSQGK